jgi:hypothetical protein
MSSDVIAPPEPEETADRVSMERRILASNAGLNGRLSGDDCCEKRGYNLEPTADFSYCWHQKLRTLVGTNWWCQWWDRDPDGDHG